jgi:hypothetical protein
VTTPTEYPSDWTPENYDGMAFALPTCPDCEARGFVSGMCLTCHGENIAPEPEPDEQTYEDLGCECEIDWNCGLHQGGYTHLERQMDEWARREDDGGF